MRAPSHLLLLLLFIFHQSLLSLCKEDTRTYLDAESSYSIYRPVWRTTDTISIRFEFRTLVPNAMLLFHDYDQVLNASAASQYAMGLSLRNGKLQATHHYTSFYEIVTAGKGLSNDEWHEVSLTKTPDGNFSITVDGKTQTLQLKAYTDGEAGEAIAELGPSPSSSIHIGGVDPTNGFSGLVGDSIVGCIRNVQFLISNVWHNNITYQTTVATEEGCLSACTKKKTCKNKGVCINHYTSFTCDCFGTGYEGEKCETKAETTITLLGLSFIEYKQYNSSDRIHRSVNRVSMQFKVSTADQDSGVLFYTVGSLPSNYIAITIYQRKVQASIDFGDGAYILNGTSNVTVDKWHSLTLDHRDREVSLDIDGAIQTDAVTGNNYHLHLDPTVYIGGGINLAGHPGLPTGRNFVGCMKNVFYNSFNILEQLTKGDKNTQHIGGPPIYGCTAVEYTPLTFPTFKSQLIIEWKEKTDLKTSFEFRTNQRNGLLLMVGLYIGNTTDYAYLTLLLANDRMEVHMDISSTNKNESREFWTYTGKNLDNSKWHTCEMELTLADGGVALFVDNSVVYIESNREHVKKLGGLRPATDVFFGAGLHNQERGFVGCLRQIVFQGSHINPLDTVSSGEANGLILDGCNMHDLCAERAEDNPCEHNAACIQDWKSTFCDCDGTGYEGTVCHFPLYKSSCEDLYQLGFRRSGVRQIDPDGIGPLPPSYVHCEMDDEQIGEVGSTMTVEHNLADSTLVRKLGYADFKKVLEYREMTSEALTYVVQSAESCSQDVTYECIKSPLYLGNQTWFSSANGVRLDKKAGFTSNCSKNDATERRDVATVSQADHLPLQELFFLQQRNSAATKGKISLSPLKCRGAKKYNQENAVTFTVANSYLLLDAWGEGDLTFNFRTLEGDVVLLFQEPSRRDSSDFMLIKVVDGSDVAFIFDTGTREVNVTIKTRPLNDGDWHYVAIEYNRYHVRFTVDMRSQWLDLMEGEDFGPFRGPLYIGSLGGHYIIDVPGLRGCFRLLTINDKIIPLQDFIDVDTVNGTNTVGIEPGCHRSCDPDPCQNDAVCTELWGSYFCTCADISHRGRNCEENYLLDIVTFPEPEVFIKVEAVDNSILTSDIRFQFRTTQFDSLLLYAHDELGNFIQVAFLKSHKLEFKFNSGDFVVLTLMDIQQDIINGQWQQVKIKRESELTTIEVNDEKMEIMASLLLLSDYIPSFSNPEQVDVHPKLTISTGNETMPYTLVYLGGVNSTMIDPDNTDTIGLEGCLRAFFVSEVPYSLQRVAARYPGVYDFCTPHCLDNPCQNSGVCEESWNGYSCDCTKTGGYRGENCEIDIGANFQNTTYLLYEFNPINTTYIQPPLGNDPTQDNLYFAFTANGTYGILAYIRGDLYSKEDEYIIVELNEQGSITVRISLGYGEETIYGPIQGVPYNDGQRHWLSFQRRERNVVLDVDDTEKVIQNLKTQSDYVFFDNKDAIVIGGIEEDIELFNLHKYKQFAGCISEFEYNGIRPIDYVFGDDEFDPTIVAVEGGDLTPASCSVYVPTIPPLLPVDTTAAAPTTRYPFEMLTFPPWYPGEAMTVYLNSDDYYPPGNAEALVGDNTIETVVIVFMVVVFVVLLLAIVCTMYNMNKDDEKQKKKAGYDSIPLSDMESGTRKPQHEINFYSPTGRDPGYKRHVDEPVEEKKVVVPPPKPPHIYRPDTEEDDDDLPVKEPITIETDSESEDEPLRRPIQAPDEEMEWDPVADTTLVSDTPKLSPTTPTEEPDPEDADTSKDDDVKHEVEEHPPPHEEPLKVSEPELEWDDNDMSPNDELPPHERLVSFEEPQGSDEPQPITEEPILVALEDPVTETTPLFIKEDEDEDGEPSPVVQPKSKEVTYEPLENEPDSADEVDHGVIPTAPPQNDVEHVPEPDEEMVHAEVVDGESLPVEHTSKIAELKTQEGVPHDVNLNDVNHHIPAKEEDEEPTEDGMPGELVDTPENLQDPSTPQRKKKKKRSSRRGSSTSGQSQTFS